jgi:pSer/pThr/pTyr-binding forkhead associated (FHA) protein/predicted protein tyrosine phosphatase
MDKCPFCGAETRPGDNFCLNCGNRLPTATPSSQQTQPPVGEATLPAQEDNNWSDSDQLTVANTSEPPTLRADSVDAGPTIAASSDAIENPARLTLRSDSGEVLQEYVLDRIETTIGRAPNSDVLLAKDKLTSRRHATVRYENGDYILRDERSANGTFVNGQQLEDKAARPLQDNDHIGIGEYELVFHASRPAGSGIDIESMPTITVPPPGSDMLTYRTREDEQLTGATSDEFGTRPWEGDGNGVLPQPESAPVPVGVASTASASAPATASAPEAAPAPVASSPAPAAQASSSSPSAVSVPSEAGGATFNPLKASGSTGGVVDTPSDTSGVTFNRLTNLPQPQLPDVAPLMAALATLDGQVSALQEQLNTTQEAMRNHESEIAQTANQLRYGVRRVSERMDATIADVARTREQLAWAELLQLMEDVMNNPRDIEYVTKLARKARELNKVFQIHQNVLNTLAECTSLLRSLIGEDKK